MATKSVGSLLIDIQAKTAKLETDLSKAKGMLRSLRSETSVISRGMASSFNIARAAVAAFASSQVISGLKNMTAAQYENARAMGKIAESNGLAVSDVQAYTKAAEYFNVTNVKMGAVFRELFAAQDDVRRGVRGAMVDFDALGMSEKFVAEAMPNQLFEETIRQLGRMGDASTRNSIAMSLFGKQAEELSPMFIEGSEAIDRARNSLNATGEALSRLDVAKMKVALGSVNEMSDAWAGFKKEVSVALAPVIYQLAGAVKSMLQSINIKAWGDDIAKAMPEIVKFISTLPERIELAFTKAQLGFQKLANAMRASPIGAMMGMDEAASDTVELEAAVEALQGVIKKASAEIDEGFGKKVEALMANIGSVTTSTRKHMSEAALMMRDSFVSAFSQLSDSLADALMGGESKVKDFVKMVVKQVLSMAIQLAVVAPMLNGLFKGLGMTSFFGAAVGAKAVGGPVMAGDVAMVGEQGPELVRFNRSGYVDTAARTANAGGGGGGVVIHVNQSFESGVSRQDIVAMQPEMTRNTINAVVAAFQRSPSLRAAALGA